MTLDSVRKVNDVICESLNNHTVIMYGRKKRISMKGKALIENHVLTGRFIALPVEDKPFLKADDGKELKF